MSDEPKKDPANVEPSVSSQAAEPRTESASPTGADGAGGDASVDDGEPVFVTVDGDRRDAAQASADDGEPDLVPRSHLLEMGRDKLRLELEVRKLQGEAYQLRLDATNAAREKQEAEERANRVQAEFVHFRRRSERERDEALAYAEQPLLERLLPVLDNFDLAISAIPDDDHVAELKKGIGLIRHQLSDALLSHDLRPLEAVGKPFDPNFHDAVTRGVSTDLPPEHVMAVLRRGYYFKDRLLRPALVQVSMAPEGEEAVGRPDSPADDAKPQPAAEAAADAPATTSGNGSADEGHQHG